MAFSDDTTRLQVSGDLTAVGNTDSAFAYAGDVFIGGTFSGTIALQAETHRGTWRDICTFTEAGVKTFEFAVRRPIRLNVSAYTSGTIEYDLELIQEYINAR